MRQGLPQQESHQLLKPYNLQEMAGEQTGWVPDRISSGRRKNVCLVISDTKGRTRCATSWDRVVWARMRVDAVTDNRVVQVRFVNTRLQHTSNFPARSRPRDTRFTFTKLPDLNTPLTVPGSSDQARMIVFQSFCVRLKSLAFHSSSDASFSSRASIPWAPGRF